MTVNGEENGVLHCSVCTAKCKTICRSCNKPFCELHVSSLDSSYCATCVDFSNTRIESKPLVDDEGVTHKGRQLILTGETWMRNRDIISKMTDVELEAKLTALKTAVHEAEMILDFRRIALTQVESEKGDRYSRKLGRRRLIGAMDSVHKSNTKIPGSPNEKVEVAKDALKALKNLGLTKDAIANILIKMTQKAKP
jgi:hypothetical protein